MATIDHPNLQWQQPRVGSWGNLSSATIRYAYNVLPENEVVRLWKIPRGINILEVQVTITDAGSASTTGDVGYLGDSAGSTDGDFFADGVTLSATGHGSSLTLQKHEPLFVDQDDLYLTFTLKSAANATAAVIVFTVLYENIGS